MLHTHKLFITIHNIIIVTIITATNRVGWRSCSLLLCLSVNIVWLGCFSEKTSVCEEMKLNNCSQTVYQRRSKTKTSTHDVTNLNKNQHLH